jgi:hypothetical protein
MAEPTERQAALIEAIDELPENYIGEGRVTTDGDIHYSHNKDRPVGMDRVINTASRHGFEVRGILSDGTCRFVDMAE